MHYALAVLLILALLFGPQLWAQYTFRRYSRDRGDFPGSGGKLARHLLDRLGLETVTVEVTPDGDHYDPRTRAVRLRPEHHAGRSLTAVAVAAHEVGHALQHARGESLLSLRTRLVELALLAQKVGAGMMVALPLVLAITRAPASGLLIGALGLASMAGATLVHLVTLPVEWDASFGKALPILQAGRYVPEQDLPAVRRILRAAALTYAAASLASLLNLGRWIALLRR